MENKKKFTKLEMFFGVLIMAIIIITFVNIKNTYLNPFLSDELLTLSFFSTMILGLALGITSRETVFPLSRLILTFKNSGSINR